MARALLGHARFEPGEVDGAVALLRDLAREIDREPEGVVQEERVVAAHVAAREHAVEQLHAARQRLAEPLFFAPDHATNQLLLLHEVGVRGTHHVDRRVDERWRDEIIGAEQERMPHRAG